MSKKKEPPDYPGDEAIKKRFGELMHKLRLQKGLSIEQVDALIDEGMQEDTQPLLPRALALVTRELREARKMSRAHLSEVSGLPLRLINRLERAKAHEITLTQVVRIAMALEHDVTDFVERVFKVEERLKVK
ncbi:MAG TPA: helix-turn-helix transcriptional regulator [Candidatus Angelobacter sp.]|nr:helix-turn-helix transcriptional regulator [Candidatus Angelobacter sp.]